MTVQASKKGLIKKEGGQALKKKMGKSDSDESHDRADDTDRGERLATSSKAPQISLSRTRPVSSPFFRCVGWK